MAKREHLAILSRGVVAWNTWRCQKPGEPPLLADAYLEEAQLEGFDFQSSILTGANLFNANLTGADLRGARLDDSDLRGVRAIGADFRGADLRNARFEGARLALASLQGADLAGADLRFAVVGGTDFGGLNLAEAAGLDRLSHAFGSTIGIDSLYRSRGNLPEIFLRGIGLPESFIQKTRDLLRCAADFNSCFISYSHQDRTFGRQLYHSLQARGVRCWLDEKNIKPGDRIQNVVHDAIGAHEKILLCCSKSSLESWWVLDEIRKAQDRERREGCCIIIPLNLDNYLFEWSDGLASDIRSRLAADFTGWESFPSRFEKQLDRVAEALRRSDDVSSTSSPA